MKFRSIKKEGHKSGFFFFYLVRNFSYLKILSNRNRRNPKLTLSLQGFHFSGLYVHYINSFNKKTKNYFERRNFDIRHDIYKIWSGGRPSHKRIKVFAAVLTIEFDNSESSR